MNSGDDIREARERAGWTQEHLAQRVGVSGRTVGNWERGASVPRNRAAKIQSVLADYLNADDTTAPLRSASDVELLAEIARRFDRGRAGGEHARSAPMNQAGQPATDNEQSDERGGDDELSEPTDIESILAASQERPAGETESKGRRLTRGTGSRRSKRGS